MPAIVNVVIMRMGLLLLLLGVNTSLAEEVVPKTDGYCLQAQKIIAGTDLEPTVVYHQDYEAFVESKPTDQPFTIHRYDSAPLLSDHSINTVVSCKLRTAERINATHDREGGAVPVASVETSCHEVHRVALENAFAAVPEPERKLQIGDWLIEEEDMQFMGPKWLEPWPFTAVTRSQGGQYQLHTRALYAPHAWWVPMPERFLGNYYCHLASPQYLEALIRGRVQPL